MLNWSYIHPRHRNEQQPSYFRKGNPSWIRPNVWSKLDQSKPLEIESKDSTQLQQQLDSKVNEIDKLKSELEAQKIDFEAKLKMKEKKIQILRYSNKNLQKAIWACSCTNSALIDLQISQWFVPQCEEYNDEDTELLLSMHEDCMKNVGMTLLKHDKQQKLSK